MAVSKSKMNKILKMVEEAMNEIAKEHKDKAYEICVNAIDRFYNDYDGYNGNPLYYDRTGDLYNVFNLEIENGQFIFELGSDFMEYNHRVNNDYIYDQMFVKGWHGGAHKGKFHPDPGESYWRKGPNFKEWWDHPALRSTSPYQNIITNWNHYMNNKGKQIELDIWVKKAKKYLKGR